MRHSYYCPIPRYLYSLSFVCSLSELVHFSELDKLGHNIGSKYLMECLPYFTVLYLGRIKSEFRRYMALNRFF